MRLIIYQLKAKKANSGLSLQKFYHKGLYLILLAAHKHLDQNNQMIELNKNLFSFEDTIDETKQLLASSYRSNLMYALPFK